MPPTRRRLLEVLAAVGTGGLAGCNTFDRSAPGTATGAASSTATTDRPSRSAPGSETERRSSTPATATVEPTGTLAPTRTGTPSPTRTTPPVTEPESGLETRTERIKLVRAGVNAYANFGRSVAVSGDGLTAVVGGPGADDDSGVVWLFERSGGSWTERTRLVAEDQHPSGGFGGAVSISETGSVVLVGSPGTNPRFGEDGGSAFVFERADGAWSQRAILVPDDGDAHDVFGVSVALSGDGETAVVGAAQDEDPNGTHAGSAYVFEEIDGSWSQRAKLAAADGSARDNFGASIAASGDGRTAFVGAHTYDGSGRSTGAAYVFEWSDGTWRQEARLVADDGTDAGFGWAIATTNDGETVVVGDPQGRDESLARTGAVYVFERSGGSWSQRAKLDGGSVEGDEYDDNLGESVAVRGDGTGVLAGAPRDEDPNGQWAGSAFLFEEIDGSWTARAKLVASDGEPDDQFGATVAAAGDNAFVGAPSDDSEHPGTGSVYVFE